MERNKAGMKYKRSPDNLFYPKQNTIIINNNLLAFYNRWKEYNEIHLTKIKIDFNNLKKKNHPPFPDYNNKEQ